MLEDHLLLRTLWYLNEDCFYCDEVGGFLGVFADLRDIT